MERISEAVKQSIFPVLPEAEVAAFATGNVLRSGAAFAVAVPEVDVVINASPKALLGRLQGRWEQGLNSAPRLDSQKLQKAAVRACTDRLVGLGGFKFRRSTFRGREPKVILVVPATLGL